MDTSGIINAITRLLAAFEASQIDRTNEKAADSNILYFGWAKSGAAVTEANWKIKRYTQSTHLTEWADGNDNYDNIYANREALTYS